MGRDEGELYADALELLVSLEGALFHVDAHLLEVCSLFFHLCVRHVDFFCSGLDTTSISTALEAVG